MTFTMARFEICWKAFGTAEVDANSLNEAVNIVMDEIMSDSGPMDLDHYMVDGCDAESA